MVLIEHASTVKQFYMLFQFFCFDNCVLLWIWLKQFVIIYIEIICSVFGGTSWTVLASFPALVLEKEGWMRAEVGYGLEDSHSPGPLRWCDPGDSEPVLVPGEAVLLQGPALSENRWGDTQLSMASPSCPFTGGHRTVIHYCFFSFGETQN